MTDEHKWKTSRWAMTWCSDCGDEQATIKRPQQSLSADNNKVINSNLNNYNGTSRTCPSCGHQIKHQEKDGIQDFPGLPAGVKFDPSDQELLEYLEAKVRLDDCKLHPLIDEFIPTLEGENGICYTHPEKLPGVSKDGLIRHFFHRPSKAYTTGTRKRRKVHTDIDENETRWHKTGKTRPVFIKGKLKGYKKILVLYTNYGKQRKPEKTNWVMHQYHIGNNEDEKDGEIVVSKIFYQTQPRQCASIWNKDSPSSSGNYNANGEQNQSYHHHPKDTAFVGYYNQSVISFDRSEQNHPTPRLIPNFNFHDSSSLIP